MKNFVAKNKILKMLVIVAFAMFVGSSLFWDFVPGKEIFYNFGVFAKNMLGILFAAFILIGLFEVWVSKEKIETHMGKESGLRGYLWALVLAATTAGGLYVAFPVSAALAKKGAKLSVIFFYISAAAIYRIPMTLIEASILGVKFTLIRLLVALPLIFVSAIVLGNVLEKREYRLKVDK